MLSFLYFCQNVGVSKPDVYSEGNMAKIVSDYNKMVNTFRFYKLDTYIEKKIEKIINFYLFILFIYVFKRRKFLSTF